jgi:hypothetical protein
MHPMTRIERLEDHLREVGFDEGDVLAIYVLGFGTWRVGVSVFGLEDHIYHGWMVGGPGE